MHKWPEEPVPADRSLPKRRWYTPDGQPSGRSVNELYDLEDLRRIVQALEELEEMVLSHLGHAPASVPQERPFSQRGENSGTEVTADGAQNGREGGGPDT
jgi:hypothetical protein